MRHSAQRPARQERCRRVGLANNKGGHGAGYGAGYGNRNSVGNKGGHGVRYGNRNAAGNTNSCLNGLGNQAERPLKDAQRTDNAKRRNEQYRPGAEARRNATIRSMDDKDIEKTS